MSLLIAGVLVALIGAGFVIYPLVYDRWGMLGDAVPASVQDREARKKVALAALKDVEYDRVAGKLDDADYHEMRGKLEVEALQALRAVEQPVDDASPLRHSCGFKNPAGSLFCAGCGQRLA
jgi:hypothetical protein